MLSPLRSLLFSAHRRVRASPTGVTVPTGIGALARFLGDGAALRFRGVAHGWGSGARELRDRSRFVCAFHASRVGFPLAVTVQTRAWAARRRGEASHLAQLWPRAERLSSGPGAAALRVAPLLRGLLCPPLSRKSQPRSPRAEGQGPGHTQLPRGPDTGPAASSPWAWLSGVGGAWGLTVGNSLLQCGPVAKTVGLPDR